MAQEKEKRRERDGRIRVISSASWVCYIPELGEQQSRNVPWREKRHKQGERKKARSNKKKMKERRESGTLLRMSLIVGTTSFIS